MSHRWRFQRAGGVDQAIISSAEDLKNLRHLDQKLWVALTCPIEGIEFDRRTLELLDKEKDGRIHASELIAAGEWACSVLSKEDELASRSDSLPLSSIDRSTDEGALIHDMAAQLLASLGKPDAKSLNVAEITEAVNQFNQKPNNGDGVVPAEAVEDEALKTAIADILAFTPEPPLDRSGAPGITQPALEAFFEALTAYVAWLDEGASEATNPLGAQSEPAHSALAAVRDKIDDYFARCRVAAYDSRALVAINREESEYLAVAAKDLKVTAEEVAHFPIARITGNDPLPLDERVNPAWADRVEALRAAVVVPVVGETNTLTEAQWKTIQERFAARTAWLANRPAIADKLTADRAREIAASDARARLEAVIAADAAESAKAGAIEQVEKLVLFNRDLLKFASNFVSFTDFYSRKGDAMFQVGTLYIDRRAVELCVDVTQAARHATMAPSSRGCLLYCDLVGLGGKKRQIAAMITDGDRDDLIVGRNGLFYDRNGGEWDATISKIVDNPISIREAFWSPYKKVIRLIEEQVAKRAAAAEAASDAKLTKSTGALDQAASGKPPEGPKKIDIGVVAALGVAVGGIVAALSALLGAFFGLGFWMPLGFVALLLAISGPSMAVAWLKLRQRNLGPLLDANGWAVNARARINVPLGKSLTSVAEIPAGAERNLSDPYADKNRSWVIYLLLLVLIAGGAAWYLGYLDAWLPTDLMRTPPAVEAPAPPPA